MSDVDFGKLFDSLCEQSKKTNTEIAKGLDVDKATIGRWRSGERMPKMSSLSRIADYFHCDIHMFIGTRDQEDQSSLMFQDAKEAALFIMKNPVMMNYGGYDIQKMSDEELLETAQEIADYMAFAINRKMNKYN